MSSLDQYDLDRDLSEVCEFDAYSGSISNATASIHDLNFMDRSLHLPRSCCYTMLMWYV